MGWREDSSEPKPLQCACELLEEAVGLLGGEPCDANEGSALWFARAESFIKEIRSQRSIPDCAEERAELYGTDPIDERNADQDAADRAVTP